MTRTSRDRWLFAGLASAGLALVVAARIGSAPRVVGPLVSNAQSAPDAVASTALALPEATARESAPSDVAEPHCDAADTRAMIELARADSVVAELARTLALPLDRPAWEDRVQALAAALGPECEARMLAISSNAERAPGERIAAAEVMRALDESDETRELELSEPALVAVRQAFEAGESPALRSAAASALATFGTSADLRALADTLAFSDDAEARGHASSGLRAGGEAAAAELARVLTLDSDARTIDLALGALAELAKSAAHDATLTDACARIAKNDERDSSLRKRALLVLGAQDGDVARQTLLEIARAPASPPELARAAAYALSSRGDSDAQLELEELAADPSSPLASRIGAAEVVLRTSGGTSAASACSAMLAEALESAEDASLRRRALASLPQDAAFEPLLERLAARDDDARVRSGAASKLALLRSPAQ